MNEHVLITGSSTRIVDGKTVVTAYSYMAAPCTIWDAALIAWAERRDVELKRRRA